MKNFVFHNPTKIYFGKGQISKLDDAVPQDETILMLYGGGSIKRNGVYDQVVGALGNRRVLEFGGIEPNPTYETLMRAVDIGRREEVSLLLSVGGGSALDGTKFVAAAIPYQGEPWDILAKNGRVEQAVPIGAVLTLPATGSEMNGNSVISRKSPAEKLAFSSRHVYPKFSILDPETTYSLPERQLANGIVDTYVHVLEQYLTYPVGALLQDRMAESILLTLIEIAPRVMQGTDYDSRSTFMWTATMALNGLIGLGVPQDWAAHSMGHELTALHGIDHARTLAAIVPSIMNVQREVKRDKLLQYAARVWEVKEGDADARIDAAIERTAAFFDSLGVPPTLARYSEVSRDTPTTVAGRLAARRALPLGERGDIDERRVVEILQRSLGTETATEGAPAVPAGF